MVNDTLVPKSPDKPDGLIACNSPPINSTSCFDNIVPNPESSFDRTFFDSIFTNSPKIFLRLTLSKLLPVSSKSNSRVITPSLLFWSLHLSCISPFSVFCIEWFIRFVRTCLSLKGSPIMLSGTVSSTVQINFRSLAAMLVFARSVQ